MMLLLSHQSSKVSEDKRCHFLSTKPFDNAKKFSSLPSINFFDSSLQVFLLSKLNSVAVCSCVWLPINCRMGRPLSV